MMKKSISVLKITSAMILLFAALFCMALFGCSDNVQDSVIDGGGDKTTEITYTFEGDNETYLKKGVASYDFVEAVKVTDNIGKKYTPEIVFNDVKLGTAGQYSVKYEYKGAEFVVTVYILDTPVIDASAAKTVYNYAEFQSECKNGVTAKDSLGRALEISVRGAGDAPLYKNGVLTTGENVLEYLAIDGAGNVASVKKNVTINANEKFPAFTGTMQFDVCDEEIEIVCDTKNERIISLIADGAKTAFEYAGGVIKINAQDILGASEGADSVEVVLVTESGYCETELTFKDEKAPVIDTFGLNNWRYLAGGEEKPLPRASKKYEYQNYEIIYKLYNQNGQETPTDGREFSAAEEGVWTLSVIPVKNGSELTEFKKDLKLKVMGAEEYDSLFASCDSTQFTDELSLTMETRSYIAAGGYAEYGYSEREDVGGAYVYYRGSTGEFGHGYILGSNIPAKYKSLSIDVWFEQYPSKVNPNVGNLFLSVFAGVKKYNIIGDAGNSDFANYQDGMKVYTIDENGNALNYINPLRNTDEGTKTWYRVEVDLAPYFDFLHDADRLIIMSESAGRFYIKNVRYNRHAVDKSDYDPDSFLNNLTFGDYGGNIGKAYKYSTIEGTNWFFDVVKENEIGKYKKIIFDILYESRVMFALYCGTDMEHYPNKVVWSAHTEDHCNYESANGAKMKTRVIKADGSLGSDANLMASDTSFYGKWFRVEFIIPDDALFVRFKWESFCTTYFRNVKLSEDAEFEKDMKNDDDLGNYKW